MPRSAQYIIHWSPKQAQYRFSTSKDGRESPLPEPWLSWLETHRSFAFHGRSGQLNLLKEKRSRGGAGYWYAYQRHPMGMVKRYLGHSEQLTLEYLETLAAALASPSPFPSSQTETLLMPKLQLPRPQISLLPRPRLLSLLDQGLSHKLTLISGPAGYGKTTLISQWLAERSSQPDFPYAACLTLDEGDNDPIRFWRYFIAACRQFYPDFGQEALTLLDAHRLPPFKPLELMLTALLNNLSQLPRSALLILDDFHAIRAPQVTESLNFLLDHLPTPFHLILLIRGDPPFPLSRLRARNELLDIQPPYLSFSLEETRAFFEQELSFSLSSRTLRQIFERLDGWPAGLRLLVSELRWPDQKDSEQVLASFAGSAWSVQEYFLTEVLHTLPADLQTFLLQTSILPHLTASLCAAITGQENSAHLLETLRGGDLFLIPLDNSGSWSRYHSLFAEAMQQEARRRLGESSLQQLSQKASLWYEAHELLPEAIETALNASTFPRAATLIERFILSTQHLNTLATSEIYTLNRWLERLPQTDLESNPLLCLHYALTLLFILMEAPRHPNDKDRIQTLLTIAEQTWRDANNTARLAEVFAFRALLARQDGRFLQAATWARQSLAWLPPQDLTWRNLSLTVVGIGEILDGHLDQAQTFLLEALSLSEQQSNISYARATRGMLAAASFEQGNLRQAHAQLCQTLAEARMQEDSDDIAHAQIAHAQILYQWNQLDEAETAALEALQIGEQMKVEEFEALATIHLALIDHARHHTTQAQQRLTSWLAHHQTPATLYSYQLSRQIQATLASFQLAENHLPAVERWFASLEQHKETLPLLQTRREQVLRLRLRLAQGALSNTVADLETLSDATQETGHIDLRLEVQLLLVQAYARQGLSAKARALLHEILTMAQAEGYLRLFLNEGEAVATLLHALLPSLQEKSLTTYVHHILTTFSQNPHLTTASPSASSLTLSEPLSAQEQKVLRLLAAGNSNAEIARELVVSVNTIRTQIQSIYRKLNVHNRSQASSLARQFSLH